MVRNARHRANRRPRGALLEDAGAVHADREAVQAGCDETELRDPVARRVGLLGADHPAAAAAGEQAAVAVVLAAAALPACAALARGAGALILPLAFLATQLRHARAGVATTVARAALAAAFARARADEFAAVTVLPE